MKYVILCFGLLISSSVLAQQTENTANPLQPFEFLIGGEWKTTTTTQTFSWGFNKQSVVSELYFTDGDSVRLTGKITWFWHPGEKTIKGYGHSVEMAMNFFDYSTAFESPTVMFNTFYGYGGTADGIPQYEKLEFIGENEYKWTYFNKVLDELKPAYGLTFKRENN